MHPPPSQVHRLFHFLFRTPYHFKKASIKSFLKICCLQKLNRDGVRGRISDQPLSSILLLVIQKVFNLCINISSTRSSISKFLFVPQGSYVLSPFMLTDIFHSAHATCRSRHFLWEIMQLGTLNIFPTRYCHHFVYQFTSHLGP